MIHQHIGRPNQRVLKHVVKPADSHGTLGPQAAVHRRRVVILSRHKTLRLERVRSGRSSPELRRDAGAAGPAAGRRGHGNR